MATLKSATSTELVGKAFIVFAAVLMLTATIIAIANKEVVVAIVFGGMTVAYALILKVIYSQIKKESTAGL